jgi:hypothetical protein
MFKRMDKFCQLFLHRKFYAYMTMENQSKVLTSVILVVYLRDIQKKCYSEDMALHYYNMPFIYNVKTSCFLPIPSVTKHLYCVNHVS